MALIVGIPNQALDANGEVMPFAEYHTFDADAPTTPKVTYSDTGLTVEHANPVVAGDDGYFPQMFAQEGDAYYLVLTPENGDPDVPFQAYEQVWSVGGDETTAFERTFADARLRITSGEVETGVDGVLIQAGRASPQNVGGYLKEEGWNGTQLDKKIVDAAETELTGNLKVTGLIARGSISPAVPIAVARGTMSAAATLDIPLDGSFTHWQLTLNNWRPDGTGAPVFWMLFSFDGGATFKTGASDYMYEGFFQSASAASTAVSRTAAAFINPLVGSGNSMTDGCAQIVMDIWSAVSRETMVMSRFAVFGSDAAQVRTGVGGGATTNKAFGKATHVRLTNSLTGSAVTTSCDYTLVGMP